MLKNPKGSPLSVFRQSETFFLSKGSAPQFLRYFTTDWVFKNPKGCPLCFSEFSLSIRYHGSSSSIKCHVYHHVGGRRHTREIEMPIFMQETALNAFSSFDYADYGAKLEVMKNSAVNFMLLGHRQNGIKFFSRRFMKGNATRVIFFYPH